MWRCATWQMPDYPDRWEFAAGGFVNRDEYLIPEVEQMAYGPVTVYLLRRFGPSEWGGDGYKEIACWYLTTPNPDVVLAVYPVASAMRHGFGYAVNTDRYNNRRDSAQKAEVIEALQAAQKDLLAPVAVRDVLINALGIVPEQDHGDDGPDDDARTRASCPISRGPAMVWSTAISRKSTAPMRTARPLRDTTGQRRMTLPPLPACIFWDALFRDSARLAPAKWCDKWCGKSAFCALRKYINLL